MIFKELFTLIVSLILLFFVGIGTVKADDCTTGESGWITCQSCPTCSEVRATTCDQLSGIGTETCGAGSGCGPTGCYNCASQGNCNGNGGTPSGNNCPQGQVWNDCASGTNTCVPGEKWNACKTGQNCPTSLQQVCDSRPYDCSGWVTDEPCHNERVCDQYDTPQCGQQCVQRAPTFACWREDCWDTGGHWDYDPWEGTWNWIVERNCGNGRWENCGGECEREDRVCWGGGCVREVDRCVGGSGHTEQRTCYEDINCRMETRCVPGTTNTCVGGYSWDNCANNGTNSCQGGCVNLPCNSVAPSTPGLTSPASGAQISGTQTSLAGATASWGTACSGQNYQFNIYLQQCDAIVTPTTLWKTVSASGNNFNELFTGVGGKGYCWTAEASNGVTTSARATAQRFIFSDQPWWQVSGGSVMTFGGVTSLVGKNQQFITDAPGVVISGSGNVFLNGADASANKWVATDANLSQKVSYRYDYDYVSGRIISTIRPNPGPNLVVLPSQLMVEPAQDYGIYWTKVTGDLDINSNLDFGTNRVVVLVEGNANIKGKINFTKNEGLFALYVKGNINIDPSIGTVSGTGVNPNGLPTHLEGLYLAQGSFNTGASASQLRLEGAFVGIGGVNLQRNLNSAWPSEYFVFRPDILINLPKQLLRQNHQWQELAP